MLREILVIALLLIPASAWEIDNGTANLTELELVELIVVSRVAGIGDTHELFAKSMYDSGKISYGELWSYTKDNNKYIREYNTMLEEHFSSLVCDKLLLKEYSI